MKIKRVLFLVCFILIAILLLNGILFLQEITDNESESGKSVTVTIPKGASEKTIARVLSDAGVIRYELSFRLKMKNSPHRGKLNYGTYSLHKGMCIDDIIEALLVPVVEEKGIKLTIPEGFSAEMIAARCEKLGICDADDFLKTLEKASFEYDFIREIPKKDGVKYRLQGYLFPSTYMFKKTATSYDVIDTLLGQFEKEYEKIKKDNSTDMEMNDIITVASLIEREAKVSTERETISGVIMNRLKKGMPLQIDASVVYVISDGLYDVHRVLYKDLKSDSLYNTYKNSGLPVGAICSPGLPSIKAAMNPSEHNYLYYRTDDEKGDGSHNFTQTYNEHLKK